MTRRFLTVCAAATVAAAASFPTAAGDPDADSVRRVTFTQVVPAKVERPEDLPPAVARELRGAWVSPLDAMTGADWPSRMGMSPEDQRAQLRILLDHARSIGLNA